VKFDIDEKAWEIVSLKNLHTLHDKIRLVDPVLADGFAEKIRAFGDVIRDIMEKATELGRVSHAVYLMLDDEVDATKASPAFLMAAMRMHDLACDEEPKNTAETIMSMIEEARAQRERKDKKETEN
jgi:hypothetical protein